MGFERDYLMRQLMLLFQVLEKVIKHRKNGNLEEAENEIRYFYTI